MHPLLILSILLFGTSLATSSILNINEEIKVLSEHLQHLEKKVDDVTNAFDSVRKARTFATGSSTLYTTNDQEGNFQSLDAICSQAGGRVPSPKEKEENASLQNVVKRHNKKAFLDVNDEPGYTNWAEEEPNTAGGTKNCVEIDKDGKWHAAACEERHLIVCEFKP